MEEKYGSVRKIVVIGDNEDTDIVGAHNFGWESVLVTTGVSKEKSLRANHTCETVLEALAKYGIHPKVK